MKEQEYALVHDIESDQLSEQVPVKQKHREADSEQNDGDSFRTVRDEISHNLLSYSSPPMLPRLNRL